MFTYIIISLFIDQWI